MSNSLACRLDVPYAQNIASAAMHLDALGIDTSKALPRAFGNSTALLNASAKLCDRLRALETKSDAEAYLKTLGCARDSEAKRNAMAALLDDEEGD